MPKGKLFGREVGIFSILLHFSKGNRQRTTEIFFSRLRRAIVKTKLCKLTVCDNVSAKKVYHLKKQKTLLCHPPVIDGFGTTPQERARMVVRMHTDSPSLATVSYPVVDPPPAHSSEHNLYY